MADALFIQFLCFAIGALVVALIAYIKSKKLDGINGVATQIVKNGRMLVEDYRTDLSAYDPVLYKNVCTALDECEKLLVSDMSLADGLKAILVFGPIFVDAAKKIGVEDRLN